jgi:formamidopyrimidine-DNA glycosylase
MPELPEVETIRRQLAPIVEGRRLRRIEILDPRWSRPLAPAELAGMLGGRRVEQLQRRGKYLVWHLSGDVHLAQHLRMTGSVLCDPDPEPAHTRVRIELGPPPRPVLARADGGPRRAGGESGKERGGARALERGRERGRGRRLAVVDPRRFGTGELLAGEDALEAFFAARLGPEPFEERFSTEYLRALTRGRTAPIKGLLLDQRRIAGVGNIYADESLLRAGIHPLRPAGRLSREQCARLRDALVQALAEGIDARGASIDDFRHIDGVRGSFQDRFLVHRRAGESCPRCGRAIVKIGAAGRGTYVCESCQPRPRLTRPAPPARAPAPPAGGRRPARGRTAGPRSEAGPGARPARPPAAR